MAHAFSVTGDAQPHSELVEHLTRTSPLSPGEAARVIADVLGYFSEPVEAFVRRRHRELKAHGLSNDEAFPAIAAELQQRAVAPPRLTLRQLRRIVYGLPARVSVAAGGLGKPDKALRRVGDVRDRGIHRNP
jgi:hypothetical protein